MASFTTTQAADVAAITQLIHEWGDELDQNDGLKIASAGVLASDCRYQVRGEWKEGLVAVAQFYQTRKEQLDAAGGAPVMRHLITNMKVFLDSDGKARANYLLLFFAKVGEPPFVGYCDPLAVADVRMECRREADGNWLISSFDSEQIFQRG